jgi:hypothetical protein
MHGGGRSGRPAGGSAQRPPDGRPHRRYRAPARGEPCPSRERVVLSSLRHGETALHSRPQRRLILRAASSSGVTSHTKAGLMCPAATSKLGRRANQAERAACGTRLHVRLAGYKLRSVEKLGHARRSSRFWTGGCRQRPARLEFLRLFPAFVLIAQHG